MTTSTTTPSGPIGQSHIEKYPNFLHVTLHVDHLGIMLGYQVDPDSEELISWKEVTALSEKLGKPIMSGPVCKMETFTVKRVLDKSGNVCLWDMYLEGDWYMSCRTLNQAREKAKEFGLIITVIME